MARAKGSRTAKKAIGWSNLSTDCNDTIGLVFPGADEQCNGLDDDCDGEIDEGATQVRFFMDADGDGYGADDNEVLSCTQPDGAVARGGDCADDPTGVETNQGDFIPGAEILPGHLDTPYDDVDQDCAGDSDWDKDLDGHDCDPDAKGSVCKGHVHDGDDCDDTVVGQEDALGNYVPGKLIFAGAPEIWYDGVDENCDAENDYDADGDGDEHKTKGDGNDCDDTDASRSSLLEEVPYNFADENCLAGDDDDRDGDGFEWCDENEEFASCFGDEALRDCDDADPADDSTWQVNADGDLVDPALVYPGSEDVAYDGIDADCDDWNDYDADRDGYVAEGHDDQAGGTSKKTGDCDDTDALVHPDAGDTWYDGIDQNCDGLNDFDADEDGFVAEEHNDEAGGTAKKKGDCDDDEPAVNPDAEENWYDGEDQDCDGLNDFDQDRDGYVTEKSHDDDDPCVTGPCETDAEDCLDDPADAPESEITDSEVAAADIHPGAFDTWYDGVDADCEGNDDFDLDADGAACVDWGGDASRAACFVGTNDELSAELHDCDDTNAESFPAPDRRESEFYDGVDENCYSLDDDDQDGDGFPCNVESGKCEPEYGTDKDCDDGDPDDPGTWQYPDDGGDPVDPAFIFPDRSEQWYDGIDHDCSGIPQGLVYADGKDALRASDYDQDRDGYLCDPDEPEWNEGCGFWARGYADAGERDCHDSGQPQEDLVLGDLVAAREVNPGIDDDPWYDGVDRDCDGRDDFDQDGDGSLCSDPDHDGVCATTADWDPIWATTPPGFDCDDEDGAVKPGAAETPYDGKDANCDGWNDYDADHDTYVHEDYATEADSESSSPNTGDCSEVDVSGDDQGVVLAASIHPDQGEKWFDGVDQNCSGVPAAASATYGDYSNASQHSDYDQDGDGYVCDWRSEYADWTEGCTKEQGVNTAGDVDCHDDPEVTQTPLLGDEEVSADAVHPGAAEVWYDGVDQDCNGKSDFDQDGDGALCSDDDHDGVCATTAEWDPSWATTPPAFDCNDARSDVKPGAADTAYDGVDTNCDGWNDYDADRDTYVAAVHGSEVGGSSPNTGDCSEVDVPSDDWGAKVVAASIHPGQGEQWFDGVDQDCSGVPVAASTTYGVETNALQFSDYDQDEDGYVCDWNSAHSDLTRACPKEDDVNGTGNLDCHDDPDETQTELLGGTEVSAASVHPGASDTWYDGVDQNCGGNDDFDQDGDGSSCARNDDNTACRTTAAWDPSWATTPPTFDCDDANSAVKPGAADPPYLGGDTNCDGWNDYDADRDTYVAAAHNAKVGGSSPNTGDCSEVDVPNDDGGVKVLAASIHPGQGEQWFDGVDQDCSGVPAAASSTYKNFSNALQFSDYDQDKDGYVCDPEEAHEDLTAACEREQDVNGAGDLDCHDDPNETQTELLGGEEVPADAVHPGASDIWYDGVDQDCNAKSDFDQDGDGQKCDPASTYNACGHLTEENAGLDCDDGGDAQTVVGGDEHTVLSVEIFFEADDPPYDGVDQDCDGLNDWDWDEDGYVTDLAHAEDADCRWWNGNLLACDADELDCNDGDYTDDDGGAERTDGGALIAAQDIRPDQVEDWYNGVDEDCSAIPDGATYAGTDERHLWDYDKDQDGYVCEAGTQYNGACPSWSFTVGGPDCADNPDVEQTSLLTSLVIAADAIHPSAADPWYDGVDQDCLDNEDFDQDGDGSLCERNNTNTACKTTAVWDPAWATTPPTFDCNDTNTAVKPGAADAPYVGGDTNCDGWNDYDWDRDTYVAEIPGSTAGGSSPKTGDCVDDPLGEKTSDESTRYDGDEIHPGAPETWYDGVDRDCSVIPDGAQYDTRVAADYDQDQDGYVCDWSAALNGDCPKVVGVNDTGDNDCNDDPADAQKDLITDLSVPTAQVNPGIALADDPWYDGIDRNCDERNDFDADGDDHLCDYDYDAGACTTVPVNKARWNELPGGFDPETFDCDDGNPSVHAEAVEQWYTLGDQNCDGWNDFDADGDRYVRRGDETAAGGTSPLTGDCLDDGEDTTIGGVDVPANEIHPGPSETWYDGVDQDCSVAPLGASYLVPPDEVPYTADELSDFDRDQDGYVCDFEAEHSAGCPELALVTAEDDSGAEPAWDLDCYDNTDDPWVSVLTSKTVPPKDVHPPFSGPEVWYDGVDQNCSGVPLGAAYANGVDDLFESDFDRDGDWALCEDPDRDGVCESTLPFATKWNADWATPGSEPDWDCDDTLAWVRPRDDDGDGNRDPENTWYNKYDDNCDGWNDHDQDRDGYVRDDNPEKVGGSSPYPGDCLDMPTWGSLFGADLHPGATEVYHDAWDQNCDGLNDYDADQDGYIKGNNEVLAQYADCAGGIACETGDCDDDDDKVNPGKRERYYNATNDDCDASTLDADQDGDGYECKVSNSACAPWQDQVNAGKDCADEAAVTDANGRTWQPDEIHPGVDEAEELGCFNELDEDCDGWAESGCHWPMVAAPGVDATIANVGVVEVAPPLPAIQTERRRLLALADLDGDGELDLVVGTGSTVYVFENDDLADGDALLNAGLSAGSVLSGLDIFSFALGDYDGDVDGDPDLAYIGADRTSVGWYRQGSDGSFAPEAANTFSVARADDLVSMPDSNGDGMDELALAVYNTSTRVYTFANVPGMTGLGSSDTRFEGTASEVRPWLAGGVDFADDPRFRLVIGRDGGGAHVLKPLLGLKPATLPLAGANEYELAAWAAGSAAGRPEVVGDLNGDDAPELVVSNPMADALGMFAVGWNVSGDLDAPSATFRANSDDQTTGASCGWAVAAGDLNGDGNGDMVMSHLEWNSGPGEGSLHVRWGPIGPNPYPCSGEGKSKYWSDFSGKAFGHGLGSYLAVGDVNNDGVDDLVYAVPGEGKTYIIAGGGL